jgi:hypothetical protein
MKTEPATQEHPSWQSILRQRVTHLHAILVWADELSPPMASAAAARERLQAALALAHKVLADRDDPKAGDKVISAQDPDARWGKHGGYYDGYVLDVAMDADSEIITAMNVLPANGDEGADAVQLIRQEEQAHGNDVERLSIDGAGYRGEVLRELTRWGAGSVSDRSGLPHFRGVCTLRLPVWHRF